MGAAQKHAGRLYASCASFPGCGCNYFRWLDPAATPAPGPPAAAPAAAPVAAAAAPRTPSPAPCPASQDVPQRTAAAPPSTASAQAAHSCLRAFLIVRAAPSAAGWHESVSLVLLPALDLPPAACTALYERAAGERRLPHAPTAACSLQPPYVRVRAWAAAAAAARDALRRCISGSGGGGSLPPLFILDTETTGLSSVALGGRDPAACGCGPVHGTPARCPQPLAAVALHPFSHTVLPAAVFLRVPAGARDHVHQLSVLNLASGQLLSLLLRPCPAVLHPSAAEVNTGRVLFAAALSMVPAQ